MVVSAQRWNQCAKYLRQRTFHSEVIVRTHTHALTNARTDTHKEPTHYRGAKAVSKKLPWLVKLFLHATLVGWIRDREICQSICRLRDIRYRDVTGCDVSCIHNIWWRYGISVDSSST